jgi:hypothetical protein
VVIDAPGGAHDAPPPGIDARSFAGVACVVPDGVCLPPDGTCCTGNGGDKCQTAASSCGGERMQCDGAEDCSGGTACCYLAGHGSLCTEASMCAGVDVIMCHPDGPATCPGATHCCALRGGPTTSPYGVCLSGGCPA